MIIALSIVTVILIFSIATMALRLQVVEGGLVNFGIAANFGVGAYAYSLATLKADHQPGAVSVGLGLSPFWGIILTIVVGLLVALVTGWMSVHLQPVYFALVTFCYLVLMNLLLVGAQSFADGSQGLSGVNPPLPSSLVTSNTGYTVGLLVLVCAITIGIGLVLRRLAKAPSSALLRLTRDDRLASSALGIHGWRIQLGTFVLGAVVATIGGMLYAWYTGGAAPGNFTVSVTFTIFIAMIVGGRGSYLGSVVGCAILFGLDQGLDIIALPQSIASRIAYIESVPIGVVLLLIIRFWPEGIVPSRRFVYSAHDGIGSDAIAEEDRPFLSGDSERPAGSGGRIL